jgi:hypothetical protein
MTQGLNKPFWVLVEIEQGANFLQTGNGAQRLSRVVRIHSGFFFVLKG